MAKRYQRTHAQIVESYGILKGMKKPQVVVFFGGSKSNHDLSKETGYEAAHYIPRSKYDVTPVRVTEDHHWQVPLGTLPQQGSVKRVMDMFSTAVPAVTPQQGLERLFHRPVAAFMTLLRGKGGDDGAIQQLGHTVHVPVIGSNAKTSYLTSDKHLLSHAVDSIVHTPYSRLFKHTLPTDTITDQAQHDFTGPFFLKPAQEEGSVGVEKLHSIDELRTSLEQRRYAGDLVLQEHADGVEVSITFVEDERGNVQVLPPTLILPKQAAFYDHLAKRRQGRVDIKTTEWDSSPIIMEAVTIARDIYDELNCRGWATIDMILGEKGPELLEVNTIPTLSEYTPFKHQLAAAGLHPSTLLDRLLTRSLEQGI